MRARVLATLLAAAVSSAYANPLPPGLVLPDHISGDLGVLAGSERIPVKNVHDPGGVMPFAFFDYGRLYARLDTFGIKTLPIGYGYLELAARVEFDGYTSVGNPALRGITNREDSIPLGIGTFQLTPIGGFFLYALHDVNRSGGNIYEITYAAELDFNGLSLYPEGGVLRYSSAYTRYFYGVSAAEAAASGYAVYAPGAASTPYLGMLVEKTIVPHWKADVYWERKWLGAGIADSPLVDVRYCDTAFVALVRQFD